MKPFARGNRVSDFLDISGKIFLIFGVANKRSVAAAIARTLIDQGAVVYLSVRSEQRATTARKLFSGSPVFVCDVEHEEQIVALKAQVEQELAATGGVKLEGIVHSIAFANYSEGAKPFHQTLKRDFLQAVDISCYSLISIADQFAPLLAEDASVVTISISTTNMAAENYGYMAPVKAALESSLSFLAKSFSSFSRVRFNAVAPALLKTSASAGIPGYVESYLYAEQVILRKTAIATQEVADTAAFLLSPRSSGITCQSIVVDGGMGVNYFDQQLIGATLS
jgi:enoyl-[acyl-carrier protein] reductase I